MEEAWPQEVIEGSMFPLMEQETGLQQERVPNSSLPEDSLGNEPTERLSDEQSQGAHALQVRSLTMTIEGAIRVYLETQREAGRSRKTLEWHQMALRVFEQYLRSERSLIFLGQITAEEVGAWMECLRLLPTSTGMPREASTIGTYARSVRAFCNWAMQQGYVERTPFAKGSRHRVSIHESRGGARRI